LCRLKVWKVNGRERIESIIVKITSGELIFLAKLVVYANLKLAIKKLPRGREKAGSKLHTGTTARGKASALASGIVGQRDQKWIRSSSDISDNV